MGISDTTLLVGGGVVVAGLILYMMSQKSQPVIVRTLPPTNPNAGIVPTAITAGTGLATALLNDLTSGGSSTTNTGSSTSSGTDLSSYGLTFS